MGVFLPRKRGNDIQKVRGLYEKNHKIVQKICCFPFGFQKTSERTFVSL